MLIPSSVLLRSLASRAGWDASRVLTCSGDLLLAGEGLVAVADPDPEGQFLSLCLLKKQSFGAVLQLRVLWLPVTCSASTAGDRPQVGTDPRGEVSPCLLSPCSNAGPHCSMLHGH